jgi:hypothetical protein
VTSDLASHERKAEHGQGGGGVRDLDYCELKFFIVKILTSKPLALKILQTIFANPAPVKPFTGVGEGAYTSTRAVFPN